MNLDGTSALITGGASGLGLASARALAKRGAHVTILDLPTSAGAEVAESFGGSADFVAADVTDEVSVAAARPGRGSRPVACRCPLCGA